jgi:hypothetical protein
MANKASDGNLLDRLETIQFRLTGLTPLLLHNVQLADPLNSWTRQIKELTSKKKGLAEDDFAAQKAKLQFLGGLYWDDEIGLNLPGYNVLRSFMEGGAMSKKGTALDQAVVDYDEHCAIDPYTGKYDTGEEIMEGGHFLTTMVKIGQSTVPATRPSFFPWSVDFSATFDPEILMREDLITAAEAAGRFKGVGDGRKKGYRKGRYSVEVI